MKTQRIVAAVAAASLTLSTVAFAQTSGVTEQYYQGTGQQDPNGPVKSPQQMRDDQRAIQQTYQQDLRNQQYQRDYRGYDSRGHDSRGRYDQRYDQRYDSRRGYDNRGYDNRSYDRSYDYRSYYREGGYRGQGRGAGPSHSYYRGDRLPYEYRTRHYVVDDWRGHHLYAPPQGYHWVQTGGDYVLAAIATGVIAAILLNQ